MTGLTLQQLVERTYFPEVLLEPVLAEEVELGRIEQLPDDTFAITESGMNEVGRHLTGAIQEAAV